MFDPGGESTTQQSKQVPKASEAQDEVPKISWEEYIQFAKWLSVDVQQGREIGRHISERISETIRQNQQNIKDGNAVVPVEEGCRTSIYLHQAIYRYLMWALEVIYDFVVTPKDCASLDDQIHRAVKKFNGLFEAMVAEMSTFADAPDRSLYSPTAISEIMGRSIPSLLTHLAKRSKDKLDSPLNCPNSIDDDRQHMVSLFNDIVQVMAANYPKRKRPNLMGQMEAVPPKQPVADPSTESKDDEVPEPVIVQKQQTTHKDSNQGNQHQNPEFIRWEEMTALFDKAITVIEPTKKSLQAIQDTLTSMRQRMDAVGDLTYNAAEHNPRESAAKSTIMQFNEWIAHILRIVVGYQNSDLSPLPAYLILKQELELVQAKVQSIPESDEHDAKIEEEEAASVEWITEVVSNFSDMMVALSSKTSLEPIYHGVASNIPEQARQAFDELETMRLRFDPTSSPLKDLPLPNDPDGDTTMVEVAPIKKRQFAKPVINTPAKGSTKVKRQKTAKRTFGKKATKSAVPLPIKKAEPKQRKPRLTVIEHVPDREWEVLTPFDPHFGRFFTDENNRVIPTADNFAELYNSTYPVIPTPAQPGGIDHLPLTDDEVLRCQIPRFNVFYKWIRRFDGSEIPWDESIAGTNESYVKLGVVLEKPMTRAHGVFFRAVMSYAVVSEEYCRRLFHVVAPAGHGVSYLRDTERNAFEIFDDGIKELQDRFGLHVKLLNAGSDSYDPESIADTLDEGFYFLVAAEYEMGELMDLMKSGEIEKGATSYYTEDGVRVTPLLRSDGWRFHAATGIRTREMCTSYDPTQGYDVASQHVVVSPLQECSKLWRDAPPIPTIIQGPHIEWFDELQKSLRDRVPRLSALGGPNTFIFLAIPPRGTLYEEPKTQDQSASITLTRGMFGRYQRDAGGRSTDTIFLHEYPTQPGSGFFVGHLLAGRAIPMQCMKLCASEEQLYDNQNPTKKTTRVKARLRDAPKMVYQLRYDTICYGRSPDQMAVCFHGLEDVPYVAWVAYSALKTEEMHAARAQKKFMRPGIWSKYRRMPTNSQ